jgi:hypothetical protein
MRSVTRRVAYSHSVLISAYGVSFQGHSRGNGLAREIFCYGHTVTLNKRGGISSEISTSKGVQIYIWINIFLKLILIALLSLYVYS